MKRPYGTYTAAPNNDKTSNSALNHSTDVTRSGSPAQAPTVSTTGIAPSTATATTSTATASTTTGGLLNNYVAPKPTTISTVALDCPSLDKQIYTSNRNQKFTLSCVTGLNGGDVAGIIAYPYEVCIEACASMNYYTGNDTACVGVQISSNLNSAYSTYYGNCWLKDASRTTKTEPSGGMGAVLNV